MTEEIDALISQDETCHIDFEFVIPTGNYDHSPLTAELLQKCISVALEEILSEDTKLETKGIKIKIDYKPNAEKPRHVVVNGWLSCPDKQRKLYMEALTLAQQGKNISKQIVARSGIKRKYITIGSFETKFSNAEHIDHSQIQASELLMLQSRTLSLGTSKSVDEDKIKDTKNEKNNTKLKPLKQALSLSSLDENMEKTPSTNLVENNATTILHEDENDNDNDNDTDEDDADAEEPEEEDGFDIVKQPSSTASNDNESFQVVDADLTTNDESSNEESQKEKEIEKKVDDMPMKSEKVDLPLIDTDASIEKEASHDDFKNVTPFVHKMEIKTPLAEDHEVSALKEEVQRLKAQHAEELNHFKNRINVLKKSEKKERQKSRVSMQIDEEIVKKQIRSATDDRVYKLESEMMQKQKEQTMSIESLQLRHAKELQKLSFKLGQTQQLHTLELANVRSTHQFETDQLKAQIRAFTGSLERESRKDAKIQELTEENEELKADKEMTARNYEDVISKLNAESDEAINNEINKRIKETAELKREINDLKQQMKRVKDRKDRLEIEESQLKDENKQKDAIIQQMKLLYLKEKKKNAKYANYASKKEQNRQNKLEEKEQKILASGKHVRKPSKTMPDRTITKRKLGTGDIEIVVEKKSQIAANGFMNEEMLNQLGIDGDDDFSSDDDFDDEYVDSLKGDSMGISQQNSDEIKLKDEEIESLKKQISNLNANIDALKEHNAKEIMALQQKIGSLQQKNEIENEKFLAKYDQLEYKYNKKESDFKKVQEEKYMELQRHRKEKRELNDDLHNLKADLKAKNEEIVGLEQNLDMIEQENMRLKEYEETIVVYEAEMDDIDEHYQKMLEDLDQQQNELNNVISQREKENSELKGKVHMQSESIANLNQMLESMRSNADNMKEKQHQLNELVESKSAASTPMKHMNDGGDGKNFKARPSVTIDDHSLMGVGNEINNAQQPRRGSIDMDKYVLKSEVDERVKDEVNKYLMKIDVAESKYTSIKNKYDAMESEMKNKIDALMVKNNELTSKFEQVAESENSIKQQLERVEADKINLLTTFMKEMDRMRDEVRKLNQINGKQH